MQEVDEPGTRVGIRGEGEMRDQAVTAGTAMEGWPGALSKHLKTVTAREEADTGRVGGKTAVPRSAAAPLLCGHPGSQPGWKHWRIRAWRPGLQTRALGGQTGGRWGGPAQD